MLLLSYIVVFFIGVGICIYFFLQAFPIMRKPYEEAAQLKGLTEGLTLVINSQQNTINGMSKQLDSYYGLNANLSTSLGSAIAERLQLNPSPPPLALSEPVKNDIRVGSEGSEGSEGEGLKDVERLLSPPNKSIEEKGKIDYYVGSLTFTRKKDNAIFRVDTPKIGDKRLFRFVPDNGVENISLYVGACQSPKGCANIFVTERTDRKYCEQKSCKPKF